MLKELTIHAPYLLFCIALMLINCYIILSFVDLIFDKLKSKEKIKLLKKEIKDLKNLLK
jgi:type III secretory pathway component EscU